MNSPLNQAFASLFLFVLSRLHMPVLALTVLNLPSFIPGALAMQRHVGLGLKQR